MIEFLILNISIVFIALLTRAKVVKKQRKYVFLVLTICFAVIVALRPEITPDTEIYIHGFEGANKSWLADFNLLGKYGNVFEYGYVILMLLFKEITLNARVFFFIITFLGLLLTTYNLFEFGKVIAKDECSWDFYDNYTIYVICFALLYNGISVRAGLSMGFGLLFLVLMLKKKIVKAIITLFVAFTLHRTSILFLAIYLIIRFMPVINKRAHFIIWGCSGLMLLSNIGSNIYRAISPYIANWMIGNNIASYGYLTEASLDADVSGISILKWLIYGFLIFFSLNNESYKKMLNLVMIGCMILSIFNGVTAISRAYDMFYLFTVPMYCALEKKNTSIVYNTHIFMKVGMCIILVLNYYIMLRLCILNYL